MKYKTKNHQIILSFLQNHPLSRYNISELYDALDRTVPTSSIYRILNELEKEQLVIKCEIGIEKSAYFQYFDGNHCHHHMHLVCEKCGKVIHINEEENDEIRALLNDKYCFSLSLDKNNLRGLCKECSEK